MQKFSHCEFCCVPEIPCIQDVLYFLRLSEEQDCLDFCLGNSFTYIMNIALLVTEVGYEIRYANEGDDYYSEYAARKIIASAIVQMCPQEVLADYPMYWNRNVKEAIALLLCGEVS